MSEGVLEREIRGERLLLHPQRALSWPARRLLVVGDTHFGKSSLFARHGIAVPAGPDATDRSRIDALLQSTRSDRLLVLGDFLHGELVPGSAAARELADWLASLRPVQLLLVVGNHDRSAASGWMPKVDWQGASFHEPPFCFVHDAADPGCAAPGVFRISGHVHPVVRVGGSRKGGLRVPVFWEQRDALVLPSFGLFTGGFRIGPQDGGRVFAAAADQVVELPWA
jgi:DNA ligase-associated metallophosphoesterase